MTKNTESNYRPNAAVIVTDGLGNILLCERIKPAGAVQTVQGGIDPGETPEEAAARELEEELGLKPGQYEIIERLLEPYAYDWTQNVQDRLAHTGYAGQNQYFFLAQVDPDVEFKLDAHIPEFKKVWWGTPEEMLGSVWKRKRPGMEAAIEAFKRKGDGKLVL